MTDKTNPPKQAIPEDVQPLLYGMTSIYSGTLSPDEFADHLPDDQALRKNVYLIAKESRRWIDGLMARASDDGWNDITELPW